ncbi:hypothetical protein CPC08DRAFT_548278 [Agrocybe pediades]|nr:hypothetical protein CPC08DRAFT_548278 [Agrocybe pediades]
MPSASGSLAPQSSTDLLFATRHLLWICRFLLRLRLLFRLVFVKCRSSELASVLLSVHSSPSGQAVHGRERTNCGPSSSSSSPMHPMHPTSCVRMGEHACKDVLRPSPLSQSIVSPCYTHLLALQDAS